MQSGTVAIYDMTGYAEFKCPLTKVEEIKEKYVEPLNPDPCNLAALNVM